ncbi:menaquinone biosynthesis family protein [Sulfuracidifex tepidarius]|uniref:1,4-dihydroxy-6-naphtoate synthase n=1 Tax=Sulfuracidifex tepidarius TaxID=1294262 RepID=A0A510DYR4_9CREN|nr:MqnA/MqnD/SBP family protein [Sulfuracidifex tepidarius]BBG25327.1 1,4-dihydroxy-6-naphtoate synthase [Sulfuracidifex tepidarius]BBG28121.1 1,4-dihydroxy-6-naphtoate synthase [Sulfuracidifex tepidarius]
MVTIKVGALADSGDLYPFIPLMEGKVKPDGFNLEFEVIPTVQDINELVLKREVDVSVPSAAMYPYIQDYFYIMGNAVASAIDGITGMPVLSTSDIKQDELPKARLIVHGPNTTAFTLYKMLVGRYGKLVIVRRVLDEMKALGKDGDVLVAVHEIKMMYAMKKLGINAKPITSMWDMWKNISNGSPMPMGMVVINKDLGKELALKFKETYEKSKKYAESHLEEIIPKDVRIMREAQGADLEEEIVKKTIWADIQEYNVPIDQVKRGLETFYKLAEEKSILPKVKEIDII